VISTSHPDEVRISAHRFSNAQPSSAIAAETLFGMLLAASEGFMERTSTALWVVTLRIGSSDAPIGAKRSAIERLTELTANLMGFVIGRFALESETGGYETFAGSLGADSHPVSMSHSQPGNPHES
jgi:hypothetical protein